MIGKNCLRLGTFALMGWCLLSGAARAEEKKPSPNIIRNASCEVVSGGRPVHWNIHKGMRGGPIIWGSSDEACDGKKSVFVEVPRPIIRNGKEFVNIGLVAGDSTGYSGPNAYPASPSTTYHFSCYIKGDVPGGYVQITTWNTDQARSADRQAIYTTIKMKPSPQWTKYEGTFKTRPDTRRLVPMFHIFANENGVMKKGQRLYVDKVSLIEKARPRAFRVPVEKLPYPNRVPCSGVTAEVKMLNGAPAFFVDGKPHAGLMSTQRIQRPVIEDGKLLLTCKPGIYINRSLVLARELDNNFEIEGSVTVVKKALGAGSNISIQAICTSSFTSAFYFMGLEVNKGTGEHQVSLIKYHGDYQRWFDIPFPWRTGKPYRIKLTVHGDRISAFVDGRLIAEKKDPVPLPIRFVKFSVYHSVSTVDDVRLTGPGGKVLLEDDFSVIRQDNWWGGGQNWGKTALLSRVSDDVKFSRHGVHLCHVLLRLDQIWSAPGKFDFSVMDAKLSDVLEEDPEGWIVVRWNIDPPQWWRDSHPDEMARNIDADGKTIPLNRHASFPSKLWLDEGAEAVAQLIRHHNSSDYGRRILGYIYSYAIEWFHFGPEGSLSDYSPAQLRCFREWVKAKYGADAALQKAWCDLAIRLDAVQIPGYKERVTGDFYEFMDPAKGGNKIADYLSFNAESVAGAISHFAKLTKDETDRKRVTVFWYGYHFKYDPSINYNARGHHALLSVLKCPDVDAICSPFEYRERQPGGMSFPASGIGGSMRLHGKYFWGEDDTRTHLSGEHTSYGRTNTAKETVNVIKRNFAYSLSLGQSLWWLDWGQGWFEDKQVQKAVGRMQEILTESMQKDRRRRAEIALVVSQRSHNFLRASTALPKSLVTYQIFEEMLRIGAPFDVFLVDDLDRMPEYKFYIFLDTFYLSDKERQAVPEKVLCGNHTVLWMYAPGYITDKGLDANAVSAITGIKLEALDVGGRLRLTLCDLDHPVTKGLFPGLRSATEEPIGPIFRCVDLKAHVLGIYNAVPGTKPNGTFKTGMEYGPGLVIKEMPNWRSVWCGVPIIAAGLLRGIARTAGVHIYSGGEDVVYANPFMVAVHARYAGKRTISLPKPASVTDAFTGEKIAGKAKNFEVFLDRNETGFWLLDW